MTTLYLFDGELTQQTRDALLQAAAQRYAAGWSEVRTGSADTVIAGPQHYIKLLAPSALSSAYGWPVARSLLALLGRSARLARRERAMNRKGVLTAQIAARGLVDSREFLLTVRAEGDTLHALLPRLDWQNRQRLISSLAHRVATLHQAGIYHGDLNCYNLIVAHSKPGQALSFTFLDNDSTSVGKPPITDKAVAQNLAQLNFWLAPGKLNRSDRLRFLKTYLQHRNKTALLPAWWQALSERFTARQRRKQSAS